MPRVLFTANLRRHVDCPSCEVAGSTVHEVFDAVFAQYPVLRGYVVDEHGAIREHVVVFVENEVLRDRMGLSDPVSSLGEIFVMQALSGGTS